MLIRTFIFLCFIFINTVFLSALTYQPELIVCLEADYLSSGNEYHLKWRSPFKKGCFTVLRLKKEQKQLAGDPVFYEEIIRTNLTSSNRHPDGSFIYSLKMQDDVMKEDSLFRIRVAMPQGQKDYISSFTLWIKDETDGFSEGISETQSEESINITGIDYSEGQVFFSLKNNDVSNKIDTDEILVKMYYSNDMIFQTGYIGKISLPEETDQFYFKPVPVFGSNKEDRYFIVIESGGGVKISDKLFLIGNNGNEVKKNGMTVYHINDDGLHHFMIDYPGKKEDEDIFILVYLSRTKKERLKDFETSEIYKILTNSYEFSMTDEYLSQMDSPLYLTVGDLNYPEITAGENQILIRNEENGDVWKKDEMIERKEVHLIR